LSYQLKRIDPFWHTHPMIPTAVAIGAICAAIGWATNKTPVGILGGLIAGAAVVAATRPAVTALLGTLGLFGGLVSFVIVPNLNNVGMSMPMKLISTLLFAAFYMVLMDALVLVIAVLYNLFGNTLGLSAIRLELAEADDVAAE
jgi:hypothetical protein